MKIGCAEEIFEVPLFAELFGYGPFAGRRNLGVRDPLFCRAVSLNDGKRRVLMIYTDLCSSDDRLCREMRALLAAELKLDPSGIAFIATHTHCAPFLGYGYGANSSGAPSPEAREIWRHTVLRIAARAVADEESIASVRGDDAPLIIPLGANRVDMERNVTDPVIRWLSFHRADCSVKLLLHNHGIHGISVNGPACRYVSGDWAGAANRMIKERKLADMPLFLLGPCGDVNTYVTNLSLKRDNAPEFIAEQYVRDLAASLAAGGKELTTLELSYAIRTVEFPVVRLTADELADETGEWEKFAKSKKNPMEVEYYMNTVRRFQEMLVLVRAGHELRCFHDLQVIRLGPATFFFIPGELFVEPGMELMKNASAEYPFVATVSNGMGGYLPSQEVMKKYPSVRVMNGTDQSFWGFYEVHGYMHALHFKYHDNIAEFVISNLLNQEKTL